MSAGKVEFVVVYKTSEDVIYQSSELNNHGPTVKGWRSSKNCEYPQQLILKLDEATVIQQIQILAHQYLIPNKIEIWIGPEECVETDNLSTQNYEYLGYITLNDNDGGSVKSRELKTITLPLASATSYVKLILYENHKNSFNRFNQVSLIGIQVTGEKQHTDQGGIAHHSSICDDLAFEMYVDKHIAQIIRMLENRKITAVQDERFEYARKLKEAMTELRSAGEKLGKLELSKTLAIQNEDYGKAKKKKTQMEEYRAQVMIENRVDDLLEKNGPLEINDEEPEDLVDKTPGSVNESIKYAASLSPIVSPKQVSVKPCQQEILPENIETEVTDEPDVYHSPVSPLHYPENNSRERSPKLQHTVVTKAISLKRPKPIRPKSSKSSYEAYDEQAIPAQRFCQTQNNVDSSSSTSVSGVGTSKLSDRDKKQASIPIAVFGLTMVKHFFSKQYSDKVEGLKLMESSMKSFMFDEVDVRHSPNKMTRAAVQLLHRTLRDKVFAVYNLSAEIIRFMFSEFIPGRVSTGEASRSLETLLPELLAKAGDTTPRIHNIATHTILSVAEVPDIRKLNIIPTHLTRLLTGNIHPRLILSRLEMVEQLIVSQGVSSDKNSGMTCRILCEFGMSAIHHPTEAVRKAAERILVHVYKVNPRFVRKQLPPDDEITRRNIMYRQLMQEFERIDQERLGEIDTVGQTQCKLVRSTSENTSTYHNKENTHNTTVQSKLSSSTSASVADVYENGQNNINVLKLNRCTFCKEETTFSEEELNIHYWKYCPLLMRCENCSEVIEIMTLRHHLLKDCDFKDKYKSCDRCLEVVEIEFLEHHISGSTCIKRNSVSNICPLCLEEIGSDHQDWNKHLVGPSACEIHPRKNYLKRH